jgi:integrase
VKDLRQNILDNQNDVSAMMFLDKFSAFLQKNGKSSSTVKGYVGFAKKYLRQCGWIRISSEDMQDYVILPINTGEEELEPLTKDELRLLIENTPNSRRKAFYMIMKDTGCRARESLHIKKKHIDLEKNIVNLLRNITKGKKRKRLQRITHETNKILKIVLKKLDDDDYLS